MHSLLIDNSTFEKNAPTPPSTLEIPERQTDNSTFEKNAPTPPGTLELPPEPNDPPLRPEPQNAIYVPVYSLFDRISVRRRESKDRETRARFKEDLARWEERKSECLKSWQAECARLQTKHDALLKKFKRWEERQSKRLQLWQAECARLQKKHDALLRKFNNERREWEQEKSDFIQKRDEYNQQLGEFFNECDETVDSIRNYLRAYIAIFKKKLGLPAKLANRALQTVISVSESRDTVVINACLPNPPDMPTTKEVRFIKARNEIRESRLSEREQNKIYDEFIYSLALALVRLTFTFDVRKRFDLTTLNGWVRYRDESTGKITEACIISLQVRRKEFTSVKLKYVDAKSCFRKLKGVGSSKLHGLVPVSPLMLLDRDDARFVVSRKVTSTLDEGENLAAMDWEEFEHLVREIFEAEFAASGGEVKITRASRDRGVDAIAFDPDPIRGGKIVIQAKRYTNTVGVDSVRDLYGTVLNEGAIKGILITTSQYGPDAYEFARDKPLTLLDGSNLLHLLESHGYKARIDLREARQVLAAEKRE